MAHLAATNAHSVCIKRLTSHQNKLICRHTCPLMNQSDTQLASNLIKPLQVQGFAFVPAPNVRALLPVTALNTWSSFAASWHHLGLDTYMADGGRYRRRRFNAYAVSEEGIQCKPPQPHYQSRDYNALNGGIERWFQPFADEIAMHPCLLALLELGYSVFNGLTPLVHRPKQWHVECHQFRIEAREGDLGQPTPEGLHRDGVDWVLVLLVNRENIAEGVTRIHDAHRHLVGSFTLINSLDAAFVDDARVYHGVTPVSVINPSLPAFRDVLVMTFRRE